MKLTAEQLNSIQNIEAETRYEAMDKVAEILNTKVGYKSGYNTSKKIISISENLIADITYKKGKVTQVSFYGQNEPKNEGTWYWYELKKGNWNFKDKSWKH